MTRVTLVVAIWLVVVGRIADEVLSPEAAHGPLHLLALYAIVTVLTVAALWIHWSEDAVEALRPRPRAPSRTS